MFPHLHRLVSCLLALLLAAAALLLSAGPASAGEGGTIKRLANAARAEAGRGPLTRDPDLDALARKWAHKIAADGALSHNPDLSEQVPEGWQGVGENVAMGYPTGAEMHRGWMNSDGHRANILGDYTHIGIAFVVVDGTSWGVQVFAKYPPGVRPTAKPKPSPRAPNAPASTNAPAKAPTQSPTQTPRPEQSASGSPAPSRTPSASASASQSPSASLSGSPSVSTSESADALVLGDSETAGPVTFTDASGGPTPGSSGLFGIGFIEIAVGLLALSGLGLLIALLLARRRRREPLRPDLHGPRHVRPVGPYPGGGPVYRGQVHPAGPGPGHPNPRYPNPGRPNLGGPKQYPGDRRPW
ncbi:CAP domain-containing protein [Nocardioides sp. NPDC006273]|uniref:CAP domain-containing protein n=1 Tax=Nocardioides sp. NPDC006273 TaxID=3155598 RepID=UPI0033BB2EC4